MKKVSIIIFLFGSVHLLYANTLPYNEAWIQLPSLATLGLRPFFIAAAVILCLLSIIAFLVFRLFMQKEKQLVRERASAIETEALNKKYRLVLRAYHTTVWNWDLVSKTIECECERCLEKEHNQCKHFTIKEDSFYSRIHPDDLPKIRNAYKRLMDGKVRIFQEEFRYKLLHAPKVYNWVESFAIVGDSTPDGQALTLVGGLVIVTERKLMEQEAKKKEQAEEANRMKSAFLSNVRHEIRTPLNAIVGFSNLIVQGCEPEDAVEYSKIIQLNNTLLLQLIDDVLDLSDIESGQIDFHYSFVDVSEMLLMLEKNYQDKAKEGVTLSCELPVQSFFAYTDGNRLVQVLKNFLSNACKFTSSGYIHMGFELTQDGLHFYVTDTGKGISEENVPLVFDRFAKFDSFTQGVGLGLSVCQTIVEKMNGKIGVYSEEKKGSTFWFTIPCDVHVGNTYVSELYDNKIEESKIQFSFHEA